MRYVWPLIAFSTIFFSINANAENRLKSQHSDVLTISQRISCQRAIEEVYWNHRTMPQNSQPRPSINEVLSDSAIESKVENSLRKSNALEIFWNRPILPEQLQSEIDRIERETKQAKTLREIYSALDDDPLLVAECLASPIVTDRKIRQWYAYDPRFHGDLHAKALADLSRVNTVEQMQSTSGHYEEQEWIRVENNSHQDPGEIALSPKEWDQWKKELQSQLNDFLPEMEMAQSRATLIPGKISRLQEDEHRFFAIAVLSESEDRIRIASISWQKVSFDDWWSRIKYSIPTEAKTSPHFFSIQKSRLPDTECVNDSWSPTPMPMVGEGFGHTAVWTGSEMIVWGGSDRGIYLNTGARYDPSTDVWTPISNLGAPSPRLGHKAIWTGTEMIVWGGYYALNTGGRYNLVTDTWVATSTLNAPSGRHYHTSIWTGTEMIVWGGDDGNELNSGSRYNPGTDTWTSTSLINAPEPRAGHSATWTGTEMIVWGGSSSLFFNNGFRYNPVTDVWTLLSNINAPEPRGGHSAIWSGSELIIWGGSNLYSYLNTGARYNPSTNLWIPLSNMNSPSARSAAAAVWSGTDMIIWGGVGCPDPPADCGAATFLSSGGIYNPTNNSWVETEKMGAPFPRVGHSGIWTGSEMIIWGGGSRTGGTYNPTTNQWIPTSIPEPNIPTPRGYFIGIWTGAEMIVWGGFEDTIYSVANTGSKYDPALNVWTEVTTINAPEARQKHSGVWTGSELIVWGGVKAANFGPQDLLNTGGRYDPVADSWTPTTANSTLPARVDHSAIWTGSDMIVWGGAECADPPSCTTYKGSNTGERYNPVLETWTPISNVNAPAPLVDLKAIWTGTQMVVFGGGSFFDLNGGRYNPTSDTWLSISDSGLSPRTSYPAVWTGTEMIIWGGSDFYFNAFRTGARYDPVNDSWIPTSLYNAPYPVYNHSAEWSGTEMIAWGGSNYTDGGRYNPSTDGWNNITTQGASGERFSQVSVWTGTQMIIWGGFNAGSTGALYCALPQSCLFCEDFEDGQLATNWDYRKPTWTEIGGELVGSSVKKKAITVADPAFGGCRTCTVDTLVQTTGGTGGKVWVSGWYCDQETTTECDGQNTIELLMDEERDQWILKQRSNGTIVAKSKRGKTILPNTDYVVRMNFDGTRFNVFVDDLTTPLITLNPVGSIFGGTVALKVRNTSAKFGYININ